MGRFIDLTGKTFGKWTVLERSGSCRENKPLWKCQCSCGNECLVAGKSLREERSKSCGHREISSRQKHPKEYHAWGAMLQRCYNRNSAGYEHYGGRGIRVCSKWRCDFEAFLEDVGEIPEGMSLDRIDVNGRYEPENCRVVDSTTQNNNRRFNRRLSYRGSSLTLAEWSKLDWTPAYGTIQARLNRGWSTEDALTK